LVKNTVVGITHAITTARQISVGGIMKLRKIRFHDGISHHEPLFLFVELFDS